MTASAAQTQLRSATRAAWLAVGTNIGLLVAKGAVGFLTGSLIVLSEALDSLVDLVAAVSALFTVRAARAPADPDHQYGHGKFEALGGAFEGILIVLTVLWIAWEAVHRLLAGGHAMRMPVLALTVLVASIVTKTLVSRRLDQVARETDSLALEADSWHLKGDIYVSAAAIAGVLGVWVGQETGDPRLALLDPVAAMVVSGLLLIAGVRVTWGAVTHLADVALPPDEEARIRRLLVQHQGFFQDFHALRSRRSGPTRLADLHLTVCRHMTVAESHILTDHLEAEMGAEFPVMDVTIHVEPCAGGCATCRYKERWPAAERA